MSNEIFRELYILNFFLFVEEHIYIYIKVLVKYLNNGQL